MIHVYKVRHHLVSGQSHAGTYVPVQSLTLEPIDRLKKSQEKSQ